MKKFVALATFVGLAAAAFAQSAPVNQIDLGLGLYATDPTGVYKDALNSTANGESNKYAPSFNWNGKYTYTYKFDAANTFKFALADDGWYGFYDGKSGTSVASGQNAGKITPSAEWLASGFDVTLGFPIYYFNPADVGGVNELKYAYKEAGYLPIAASNTKSGGKYPLGDNSVIATTSLTAAYKYSFDKTTWVSGQAAGLLGFNPTPWLFAFLPKVSGGAYGVQLDIQLDDYNGYASNINATTSLKDSYYDLYLEPKLTYDLGFLSLVPGLKVYTQARIALATNNPAYASSNNGGTTQKFHDTYIQPGVNYSFAVPSVGAFTIDAGWRFQKIDNVGDVVNGTGGYSGLGSDTKKDVAPYSDLRIAVGYTYKF